MKRKGKDRRKEGEEVEKITGEDRNGKIPVKRKGKDRRKEGEKGEKITGEDRNGKIPVKTREWMREKGYL
ncbi:MAG: hypothetical protein K5819_01865 [Lachnospiraceae bacterium]|nr:hypothetical protein [Lachnospiraceae bacterium]